MNPIELIEAAEKEQVLVQMAAAIEQALELCGPQVVNLVLNRITEVEAARFEIH